MIRNIVFDMGNVLIRFSPEEIAARYTENAADTELLLREVYRETEWIALDEGAMSLDEAVKAMNERLPERLHEAAGHFVRDWWREPIDPVAGMEELIAELHENGYRLYMLSNASVNQIDYHDRVPGHAYFDGRLVSAEEHLIKPDVRIYELLMNRYALKPKECVFIDDNNANVRAALHAGMEGIVFHDDVNLLRQRLKEKGVRIS